MDFGPPSRKKRCIVPVGTSGQNKAAQNASRSKASRIRGATLPPEYDLARFTQNLYSQHTAHYNIDDEYETLNSQHLPFSWSTETAACEWTGVQCNTNGTILIIYWADQLLRGSPEWHFLPSSLKILELGARSTAKDYDGKSKSSYLSKGVMGNRISGTVKWDMLPSSLETLGLGENEFSKECDIGALPKNMQEIDVFYNNLDGPLVFTHCPQDIRVCILARNSFSGLVDFSQLPHTLSILSISYNNLEGWLDTRALPPKMILHGINAEWLSYDHVRLQDSKSLSGCMPYFKQVFET